MSNSVSSPLFVTAPLTPASAPVRRESSRTLIAAGIGQMAATLTPAVRVRLVGTTLFLRLPDAGAILLALGVLTIVAALRPYGWWRCIPGIASGGLLSVVYWRIVHTPSGTFIDPVLRHAVHPAWGFIPMALAVLASVVGAALVRKAPDAHTLLQPELR